MVPLSRETEETLEKSDQELLDTYRNHYGYENAFQAIEVLRHRQFEKTLKSNKRLADRIHRLNWVLTGATIVIALTGVISLVKSCWPAVAK